MDATRSEDGDSKRQKAPKLSITDRKRMSNYFAEYCNVTSLHGFRYLGEQMRSCLEKLWWLLTLVMSIFCCAYLITQTYNKWVRSPIIVSFATAETPIWQIPFPAVTICPETKSRQSILNFTDLYNKDFNNLTDFEIINFEYISLICNPRKSIKHLKSTQLDESVLEFYNAIAPSFETMFQSCIWMGEEHDCTSLFTPILTDDGVCYTFNMLDRDELFHSKVKPFENYLKHNRSSNGWSVADGYSWNANKYTFPRRALFSGAMNGLQITMRAYEYDLDYICGDSLQGYKILLHHPAEIPRVTQQYFRVPLNQAVVAAIKPDLFTTVEELRFYSPIIRQCFFPDEGELYFFKTYTQQNCEIECLTNYTLYLCGCVDFHMPRIDSTPICGPAKIKCMKHAERSLLSSEIDLQMRGMEYDDQVDTNVTVKNTTVKEKGNCECLRSCSSLRYNTETSQSDWDWFAVSRSLGNPDYAINDNIGAHLSKLVLYFKDMQFIAAERDELYGPTQFLANCGGLLGLFTGFSLISLVEIIYFLSLRLVCNIRLHR